MAGLVSRVAVTGVLLVGFACAGEKTAPTAGPATDAGAPARVVDPLDGLDAVQRWSWALEHFPALARPDRAPAPDFSRFGAPGASVVLYSPDLAEHVGLAKIHKPCAALELAVQPDRLVTRIPGKKGAVSPKVTADHVVLELGAQLVVERGADDAGGSSALLTELGDAVIRYGGAAAAWTVVCGGDGRLRRSCGDGTRSECSFCELTLVPDPSPPVQGPSRHHGEGPCPPCPPDDDGPFREPLSRVAAEQSFVADGGAGPVFYRARDACKAARKNADGLTPAPDGRTHGLPLHPMLVVVCDQIVARDDGTREAATLYESTAEPASLVRWYERATGIDARGDRGIVELRRPGVALEIGAPEKFESTWCAEPSAPAMTLVRVASAIPHSHE